VKLSFTVTHYRRPNLNTVNLRFTVTHLRSNIANGLLTEQPNSHLLF
jgi:hypothetical protein